MRGDSGKYNIRIEIYKGVSRLCECSKLSAVVETNVTLLYCVNNLPESVGNPGVS